MNKINQPLLTDEEKAIIRECLSAKRSSTGLFYGPKERAMDLHICLEFKGGRELSNKVSGITMEDLTELVKEEK